MLGEKLPGRLEAKTGQLGGRRAKRILGVS